MHEPDLDLRADVLSGDLTAVVASRQGRPQATGDEECPFCPGGLEAPETYDVKWFTNRWPPLPDGRAEVVLYTPEHDASFASLGPRGARRVVDLWAERSAALGARDDVAYVLVFENRGPQVGATIAHPHGQIYAYASVPPKPAAELTAPAVAALGPEVEGERLVSSAGHWRAWVPWAATWPYELLIAPREQVPDLPSLPGPGRQAMAEVLVDSLGRLDALFGEPMPLMMWIHQRPFDAGQWDEAWLHIHVVPILRAPGVQRYVAAAELGGGLNTNPVDPESAAADLRSAAPGS